MPAQIKGLSARCSSFFSKDITFNNAEDEALWADKAAQQLTLRLVRCGNFVLGCMLVMTFLQLLATYGVSCRCATLVCRQVL